jgi:hypothetical protein
MYPSSSVSFDIAQARIADLHHQARREDLARTVARSAQPDQPRVPARLRFRSVLRHRAAAAAS